MATRMLRRGLPRVKGGEAWPPAIEIDGTVVLAAASDAAASSARDLAESTGTSREEAVRSATSRAVDETAGAVAEAPAVQDTVAPVAAASAPAASGTALRRGLPRVAGGDPWPPASASASASASAPAAAPSARDLAESTGTSREEAVPSATSRAVDAQPVAAPTAAPAAPAVAAAATADGVALRRGLPRAAGGDPWPPAGTSRVSAAPAASAVPEPTVLETAPAVATPAAQAGPAPAAASTTVAVASALRQAQGPSPDVSTPLPFARTVWQGTTPRHAAEPEREPSRLRPPWPQAIGGLLGLAALGLIAVAGVFLIRAFLSLSFMQDFLTTYPGEYHPAVDVNPGFAPWVGWQHFFNMFLMVLIIRSGLRVRSEKRPTAFWTARGKAKTKISLTLWFHQSLDLLWIINGVIFVVLIITTGHWARIVPTSWEVFPNALSAGLQYVSFDWPLDNGWVNYNSLQQLAYFTTVFLAAPLAVVTGFRMSGLWPTKAEKLSKAYPVEWARALHFPTMLYFVAFIIVHVALVFLTGALRNLNHMFASLGSVDGVQYAANWTGFGIFVLAMIVIAGGWFAARPLVLAPIAKLFGQVSGR
ncbi:thiosulfate reductase cytochrome b subunit [Microbacterium sp. W4I4]|uniref:cytochrome b/b6 domain-containing protein n=1 Tax=Microbacterium sp. W4I4 TaxID=3042295 RepID=UPI002780D520|nr:cytochrome b/b6 domain-containing protein [Microbacterium sp. W4I4]MDQ0615172.1 thiosulfate reductase cytochrome b subunit [Microbacterium sp. W4I4]